MVFSNFSHHAPKDPSFFKKTPVLVTILMGIIFAVLAFFIWREWENQRISFQFHRAADRHAAAFKRQVDLIHYLFESVNAFFLCSIRVEKDEFSKFVQPFLKRMPTVSAIAWMPRVIQTEQQQFTARDQGGDSHLLITAGHGNAKKASFPIHYLVARDGSGPQNGLDLSHNEIFHQAMKQACDTGHAVATNCSNAFFDNGEGYGFWIFLPVYAKGKKIASKADRCRFIKGYISGAFQLPLMAKNAMMDSEKEAILVYLFERTNNNKTHFLYTYPPKNKDIGRQAPVMNEVIGQAAFHHQLDFEKAGKKWHMIITALPEFVTARRGWAAFSVPLFILFFSGIAAVFIQTDIRKKQELSRAYQNLKQKSRERRDIETALKRERDFSESLIQGMPLFFIAVDAQGVVQLINKAMLEAVGASREEIIGKKYFQIFVCEEDNEGFRSAIKQLQKSPTPLVREACLKTNDNRQLLVEWHDMPIVDDQGQLVHYFGVGIDITKRRREEEALWESEERYSKLIETSPDGIFICNLDGQFLDANQSFKKMTGFNMKVLRTMSYIDLAYDPSRVEWQALPSLLTENNAYGPLELALVGKDKTILPISLKGWVIRDKKGLAEKFGFWVKDISTQHLAEKERKALMEKLQQAQKMEAIGTLAGGIAHDFNNILGVIIGYGQLLRMMDTTEGSEARTRIDEILAAGNRAKDLVYQILTFSRKTEQERKPIQIAYIVKEAIKFLRASIPTTIEIRTRIDKQISLTSANPTQMHQILMNLCTNAAHAMRETGGVLEIALHKQRVDETAARFLNLRSGTYVKLTVRDSGHGMHPRVLNRIFDPYFTTKDQGEGTGLGLAVVHGIVESYNGAVHVESEPGKGTTFELFFPAVKSGVETEQSAASAPLPEGNEKILFVDDKKQIARIVKSALEKLGYQVVEKTNSLDALETFKKDPYAFELVITDLTMPKMTGLELARELKAARPDIPIILSTGFSQKITQENITSAKIHGFIEKPFMPQELALKVREVLDEKMHPSGPIS